MINRVAASLFLILTASPAFACPAHANEKSTKYHASCADKSETTRKSIETSKTDTPKQDEARAMIAAKALEQTETRTKRIPLSRSGGSASGTYIKVPVR